MKLKDFPKTAKVLNNLIAFKWHKIDRVSETKSGIVLPETIHEGDDTRLGHKYTCEALAVGPDVKSIKVGDYFLLHEYGKIDQGDPWDPENVMFVEEKEVQILLTDKQKIFVPAADITEAMMDHYDDDE